MSNQKIIKAIAGIAAAGMMATCLPVAAFAATGDTYHFSFSNGSSQDLAPGGSMTFPASQYDYGYWITLQATAATPTTTIPATLCRTMQLTSGSPLTASLPAMRPKVIRVPSPSTIRLTATRC